MSVKSPNWDAGLTTDVGAATWVNGQTGLAGPVSAANSLVGNSSSDHVGRFVIALGNGDYVVLSPDCDISPVIDAGAATWADGSTGRPGQSPRQTHSMAASLVTKQGQQMGSQ